jgi:hypothetical protein
MTRIVASGAARHVVEHPDVGHPRSAEQRRGQLRGVAQGRVTGDGRDADQRFQVRAHAG